MNLSLSSTGILVGFPEIAISNMYLAYGSGDTIEVSGGFLLESEKINKATEAMIHKGAGSSKYVAWTHDEMWLDAPRAAFAANPIVITYDKKEGECHFFSGNVYVKYPMKHVTTVVPGLIKVDEGIYGEMQRRGSYKPFTTKYKFSICNGKRNHKQVIWIDDLLKYSYILLRVK